MSRQNELEKSIREAIKAELASAATYRLMASREKDERRKAILEKLAGMEDRHAEEWAERLKEMGLEPPPLTPAKPLFGMTAMLADQETLLEKMEAEEESATALYGRITDLGDERTAEIAARIREDERSHDHTLSAMRKAHPAQTKLDRMHRRERWHVRGGSWIGDAIYGVNDGLGAVFGIVSGMAGASGGANHNVLIAAGLVGAFASSLSMGTAAYLAAKSEREVYEAELGRERKEFAENPQEEIEELSLFYQLKGFSESEADVMAHRLAEQPEHMLQVKAQEELGLSEATFPNPWSSSISATLSTAVGGLIPVLPFFFADGIYGIIWSAIVSVIAHFAVGAAKSMVTARKWWISGLEMTAIAFVVGALTFFLGGLFQIH